MDRRAFATGAMSWQEGNFELRIAECGMGRLEWRDD
jgi:hypothetical protein